MSKEDLIPFNKRTEQEQKEIARKGGVKSGKVRREKKMMSQIYSEFLEKKHDVVGKNGQKKRLSGNELLAGVMSKILSRGDSSSVALMREIRQAMEGDNINFKGAIKTSQYDLSKLTDEQLEQLENILTGAVDGESEAPAD